jgi:glycosyltransferase involved in cell wall biosynthesis
VTVSIVIATYNRAALLADCLAHLARQAYADGDEVIVVDNASTDGTPRVIEWARGRFPIPLRHLEEPTPGKSRAVARAVDVASGEILAFTDDDVNVADGWLTALRAAIGDPAVALVGGPVAPRWESPPPRWLRRATESYGPLAAPLALLDYGPSVVDLGVRTVIGANMAVRRTIFMQIGGFAPHLGKLRGSLLSGEDRELCRLVQACGSRAIYCPDAAVRHWVPADRMRLSYYLSWFFWSGITHATLDADQRVAQRTVMGVPRYLIRRAAVGTAGVFAALIACNVVTAVERALDVAFASGYASQVWRAPRAAKDVDDGDTQVLAASESGDGGGR